MARARAVSGRRPAVSGRRTRGQWPAHGRSVAGAPRSAAGARAVSGPINSARAELAQALCRLFSCHSIFLLDNFFDSSLIDTPLARRRAAAGRTRAQERTIRASD